MLSRKFQVCAGFQRLSKELVKSTSLPDSRLIAPGEKGFIWEHSGLFEGDIMLYDDDSRNGLLDESYRWSNATIPFYIEEDHFDDKEVETILSAIKEFNAKTCLKFKPYKPADDNWVVVTGNEAGCWSSVGMKGEGGQQLNVNSPKCVKKGVVIHEFLHAAGFYHQQSATDRDDYVKIRWENILEGHESNFNKYTNSQVTDFGFSYDYGSIMHYSGKAFSKNGNDTIEALRNTTVLGQRKGFSDKDVSKLNQMYNASCHPPQPEDTKTFKNILDWFRSMFE
jgi:Astacin (Peptidase family M12A)